ncbi:unnamed protein product [Scytosiphon promiscuus]
MRSSSRLRASFHIALASSLAFASLAILLVFAVVRLPPVTQAHLDMSRPSVETGVPPHEKLYRAHEVERDSGLTKFVLQEGKGGGGGGGGGGGSSVAAEAAWRTLTFEEVVSLWRHSRPFTEMFADSMKAVPFEAVFWESAPVTRTTMNKPYEYVIVNAPRLAEVSADGSPFAEYIDGATTDDVVSFRNLRKDACLVVPRQGKDQRHPQQQQQQDSAAGANYAHLAEFVRTGPREQVMDFFAAVGAALDNEVASRTDEAPVWLSTSGLGVYWLHVRLDSTPKYYTYSPYTTLKRGR